LRFDGRVAVVTGAGRGIGAGYARLLADRGAHVVVNDLGGEVTGEGSDPTPAAEVVASIVDVGGSAVADHHDIATEEGASALVQRALDTYGRIDVLVNNAGIMRWARMPHIETLDFERHLAVHLTGSFLTARAAWPHMAERGYGRIVMTTSAGVFGLPDNTSYAAAKGGVIGLTRSLALAGRKLGIRVNAVAPAAVTRMGAGDEAAMPPELAAPLVAYLAHEECPVNGEVYAAGTGRFARIVLAATPGYVHSDGAPTVEDVVAHWDEVNDTDGFEVPADLMRWWGSFTSHLPH